MGRGRWDGVGVWRLARRSHVGCGPTRAQTAGARHAIGHGAIVSHMQIDANKICDQMPYLHFVWSAPLQLGIALYMLYQYLGVAGLGGVTVAETLSRTRFEQLNADLFKRCSAPLTKLLEEASVEKEEVTRGAEGMMVAG